MTYVEHILRYLENYTSAPNYDEVLDYVRTQVPDGEGDNHLGRITYIEGQYVYKPRFGYGTQAIEHAIMLAGFENEFSIPSCMIDDEFYVQERVFESDRPVDYRKLGILIAFSYVYNFVDLHHENIIISDDGTPVVVDLETFGHPKFPGKFGDMKKYSVHKMSILPYVVKHKGKKHIYSKKLISASASDAATCSAGFEWGMERLRKSEIVGLEDHACRVIAAPTQLYISLIEDYVLIWLFAGRHRANQSLNAFHDREDMGHYTYIYDNITTLSIPYYLMREGRIYNLSGNEETLGEWLPWTLSDMTNVLSSNIVQHSEVISESILLAT